MQFRFQNCSTSGTGVPAHRVLFWLVTTEMDEIAKIVRAIGRQQGHNANYQVYYPFFKPLQSLVLHSSNNFPNSITQTSVYKPPIQYWVALQHTVCCVLHHLFLYSPCQMSTRTSCLVHKTSLVQKNITCLHLTLLKSARLPYSLVACNCINQL